MNLERILFVSQSVKHLGRLVLDLLCTAVMAWAGQRWIAGFDVRGPFLLMSPLYAISIFFLLSCFGIQRNAEEGGKPNAGDVQLIQSTALEFGLGSVDVITKEYSKELRLIVKTQSGDERGLPTNWSSLSFDAKRFAVVWNLGDSKKPRLVRAAKQIPSYATRYTVMAIAGINLWYIIPCHVTYAIWFAYQAVWRREQTLTKQDIEALKIMRDLKAAIAFAKADPANGMRSVNPEHRVAALKVAAVRMGIS